ncbi:transposase [Streptomyces sp. SID8377]|nr:transposase [Streptomyces sp. SID8377]
MPPPPSAPWPTRTITLWPALNGTFKAELIEMQGPWRDFDQVERATFQWVTWYNEERLHSALEYVPPAADGAHPGEEEDLRQAAAQHRAEAPRGLCQAPGQARHRPGGGGPACFHRCTASGGGS